MMGSVRLFNVLPGLDTESVTLQDFGLRDLVVDGVEAQYHVFKFGNFTTPFKELTNRYGLEELTSIA